MAAGTLYTYPDNFRAFKVQIAAQYSGANIKVVKDPPQFKLGETNKSDEFLKKFPLGKVPAFETNDGVCLFESNAIAQFVGNEQLRGNNAKDAAFIQQWINLADNEILPAACTWVYPCLGIMQFNKQNTERAKEDLKKVMSVLNNHLLTRTFLVGERVTLADISVACNLLSLYQNVFDPSFRAPFGNVNRYFNTLINQPQFKAVLGDVKLAEKMAVFDSKKYAEFHAKPGGGKKDKKEKQPQQAKKQPEKKKEKKEEEDDEPPKPKENKDPFAALPEGTFVMDTWKKTYSNNDTTKVALPYFWENFDKENYSIWFCEYSYPEDLTMVFMSCNLMGGMMQRLDRMRKHSFGSMCLFGENDDSTISGVWIWRGQNLAFELHEDLQVDYSSYAWRKLDPNTEETKKLVDNYFRHEDFTNPRPFNQGKIFK